MTVAAVFLIAVGLTDCGSGPNQRLVRRLLVGTASLALVSAATIRWSIADAFMVGIAAAGLIAWLWTTDLVSRTDRHHAVPVAALAGTIAGLAGLSGLASPVSSAFTRWLDSVDMPVLETVAPKRVLMAVGVFVLQVGTGNQIVRLVLGSVGAVLPPGRAQPSDRLKGGRLLGPMERITILFLASVGELAAAGIVVAAKGLIRFPELNAGRNRGEPGIDAVTEYFLVGTFCSWMVALAGLGLLQLT